MQTFYTIFFLGVIHTELGRNMPPEQLKDMLQKFPHVKTLEQGASTSVWAAVAPELDGVGGKYLENCQVSKISTPEAVSKENEGHLEYAVNLDNARKFWDLSIEWIKAK